MRVFPSTTSTTVSFRGSLEFSGRMRTHTLMCGAFRLSSASPFALVDADDAAAAAAAAAFERGDLIESDMIFLPVVGVLAALVALLPLPMLRTLEESPDGTQMGRLWDLMLRLETPPKVVLWVAVEENDDVDDDDEKRL